MEAMSKNRLNPITRAYKISMLIPDLKTSGNMKDKKNGGFTLKTNLSGREIDFGALGYYSSNLLTFTALSRNSYGPESTRQVIKC